MLDPWFLVNTTNVECLMAGERIEKFCQYLLTVFVFSKYVGKHDQFLSILCLVRLFKVEEGLQDILRKCCNI